MEENDLEDLVPVNPIEEKDKQIFALEKSVEHLGTKDSEIAQLKESLCKSKAELNFVQNQQKTTLKRLSFTQKATEQRLLESITNMDGFIADPVHIGVYSATLDESEFDFGEESENFEHSEGRSRKDAFLKRK